MLLNNSDIKSIGLLVVLAFPPLLLPTYLLLNFSKAWFTILAELSMEAHLDITDKSSNPKKIGLMFAEMPRLPN